MSAKIRCVKCGAEFGCNPGGACWCKEIPPVAPVPSALASCLCPGCLRALAETAAESPGPPEGSSGL